MPFSSDAQRKWMWAKKPEMAKRWQKHTPKGKDLPEHVKNSGLAFSRALEGCKELLPDPAKSAERMGAFKVGFLFKLAELGLTPDEFHARLKQADLADVPGSVFMGATDAGKTLLGTGLGWAGDAAKLLGTAALAAPVILGGATGAAAGFLNSPSVEDIEVLRKAEKLELYKRLTQEIMQRQRRKVG